MRRSSFREKLSSIMIGRYGGDAFGRFISICACISIVVSVAFKVAGATTVGAIFSWIALALIVWCYIRIFSRNTYRRSEENRKYLSCRNRVAGALRLSRNRFRQRKEYVFFRCPGCREIMRVPRGKGKIRITCSRCGYRFEKKT